MNRLMYLAGVLLVASIAQASTIVQKSPWGATRDGKAVDLYRLTDGAISATIFTFGARLVTLQAPDRRGKLVDVVLGTRICRAMRQMTRATWEPSWVATATASPRAPFHSTENRSTCR